MRFGYRHSLIQETGDIVVSAKFGLAPVCPPNIRQEMERLDLSANSSSLWNTHVGRSFKSSGTFCWSVDQ